MCVSRKGTEIRESGGQGVRGSGVRWSGVRGQGV
jgi:hypothetical protein